jgi:uridine kinase
VATAAPRDGVAVRLGIDGPVAADAAALADAVAEAVRGSAVPVARVREDDFLRARSLRLEYGRDDPDAFHDLWYDVAALRREVLDPLGAGGDGRFLPRLRDPGTDRPVKVAPVEAAPGTVLVLDGRFLLRDDVRDAFDVTVHLDVSPAARARRLPAGEAARVLPAWDRYLAESAPAGRADVVVRFDHPDRPAVIEQT